jgi:hypothetical protein
VEASIVHGLFQFATIAFADGSIVQAARHARRGRTTGLIRRVNIPC